MANVHGLFSDKDKKEDSGDEQDENTRFVGGIGSQGGGSGLAVEPNTQNDPQSAIFGQAQNATADEQQQQRRTITMYRSGFQVDDGPYRRLDDPANRDFLRALAAGRTPQELSEQNENVVVGLIDKRDQEYVETFQSFSGAGESLGSSQSSTSATTSVFATLVPTPELDASQPSTSIAVRLLNGKRKIVKINLSSSVAQLASAIGEETPFRLVSGFPPAPLEANKTIEEAGLKGAQVSVQKA